MPGEARPAKAARTDGEAVTDALGKTAQAPAEAQPKRKKPIDYKLLVETAMETLEKPTRDLCTVLRYSSNVDEIISALGRECGRLAGKVNISTFDVVNGRAIHLLIMNEGLERPDDRKLAVNCLVGTILKHDPGSDQGHNAAWKQCGSVRNRRTALRLAVEKGQVGTVNALGYPAHQEDFEGSDASDLLVIAIGKGSPDMVQAVLSKQFYDSHMIAGRLVTIAKQRFVSDIKSGVKPAKDAAEIIGMLLWVMDRAAIEELGIQGIPIMVAKPLIEGMCKMYDSKRIAVGMWWLIEHMLGKVPLYEAAVSATTRLTNRSIDRLRGVEGARLLLGALKGFIAPAATMTCTRTLIERCIRNYDKYTFEEVVKFYPGRNLGQFETTDGIELSNLMDTELIKGKTPRSVLGGTLQMFPEFTSGGPVRKSSADQIAKRERQAAAELRAVAARDEYARAAANVEADQAAHEHDLEVIDAILAADAIKRAAARKVQALKAKMEELDKEMEAARRAAEEAG
jgi:hypothetical protein